ncbi:HTH_38 domain-containing protein [Trichonephila clavipes]|nr:HTH_38 domain-containing protein [Trichonephila clavipes]
MPAHQYKSTTSLTYNNHDRIHTFSCLPVPRGRHRTSFEQVSEFDRERIVVYRNCELSFREIGQCVGRNQATVMQICHCWMQERTTDHQRRSYSPHCTPAREDRLIMRMTVMDRATTFMNHSAIDSDCYTSFGSLSYHETPFAAEWNVHKTSIASFTLDWKPLAFALPMVR